MRTREKIYRVALVLQILILTACGADKNQEDYRKSLAQAYSARVTPIVGTYSGQIKSAIDNSSIGNLTLTVVNDDVLQTSADGVTTEQQTIIRGSLQYTGVIAANVDYDLAFYNPDNNVFQVNVKQTDSTGKSHLINVEGNIVNGQFNGVFLADTYQSYGGQVHLVKNAVAPNSLVSNASQNNILPNLKSARAREVSASTGTFAATWPDTATGMIRTVKLTLKSLVTDPYFKLIDVFSPKHNVSAEFKISKPDTSPGAAPGAMADEPPQTFTAQVDDQNDINYLTGTQIGNTNSNLVNKINCARTLSAPGVVANLDCSGGGVGGVVSFPANFVPVGNVN